MRKTGTIGEYRGTAMIDGPNPRCKWCPKHFYPRASGGKAQEFCQPSCRRLYDAGLRAFAQQQLSQGAITIADLKSALSNRARDSSL